MAALTKTALLALVMLLPSYSQESSSTGGTGYMITLWHHDKYVLFIGEFLDDPQEPQPVNTKQVPRGIIVHNSKSTEGRVKIKSTISENIDTTDQIIISQFDYFKTDCKDRKFEKNKNYLMIGFINAVIRNENYYYYYGENGICNSIYDNTPENREILTEMYNSTTIIY